MTTWHLPDDNKTSLRYFASAVSNCQTCAIEEDTIEIIGDSIIKNVADVHHAIVRSYCGDTIEDICNHVITSGRATQIYHKKAIIIHAGTNDIHSMDVQEMLQDLKNLIDAIRFWPPDVKICVSGIIPRPCDFNRTQFNIQRSAEWKIYGKIATSELQGFSQGMACL